MAGSRALATLFLCLTVAGAAAAQALPDEISALPWTLDGAVSSAVRVGDVLYVGGDFTGLAPRNRRIGPFGVFDAVTGELQAADPNLLGQATAIVDDGVGGWFLAVGHTIVRLDARGRQQPWTLQITGTSFAFVHALVRVGNRLLIGGTFSEFAGQPRGRVAAVDIPTATLLPFDAAIVGTSVAALHVSGTHLYIGGQFTSVAGQARSQVAKIDLSTGTLLPWAPQIDASGSVMAILETAGRVYLGGQFFTVDGAQRVNLAAVSAATAALEPFSPLVYQQLGPSSVRTLAFSGSTLFAGGVFDTVGTTGRTGAAAFDASTGTLLPWAPLTTGWVSQIALVTDGVVLAGQGLVPASDPTPRSLIKVSPTSAVPLAWQPSLGGPVSALWTDGARVAAGGAFSTYGAAATAYVVGLNLVDGSYTTLPAPNGPVNALATDGARLFLGGSFSSVAGQPRTLLAAIDLATRQLLPYAPVLQSQTVFAQVTALHLSGGRLYVGGGFDLVNGSPRVLLAALDPTNGALLPWAPPVISGDVFRGIASILAVSGRVWIGGRFSAVGGTPRNGLAALTEAGAALDPLDFAPNQPTIRLALDQGHVYVSGYWSQFGGLDRLYRARFDAQSGVVDAAWRLPTNSFTGMSVLNGEVYVTGAFTSPTSSLASFRHTSTTPAIQLSRTAWAPLAVQASDVAAFTDGVFASAGPSFGGAPPYYFPRRPPGGAPDGVTDFGVHLQGDIVTLRWTPSLSGAAPSGYRLIAGRGPGGRDIADVVLGRTPALTVQLPPGPYFVRIAPIANGVVGPPSPELGFNAGAAGCVTVPAPPVLSVSGVSPLLQWSSATTGSLTGFELRAGIAPDALDLVRVPLPAAATAYSTTGAPPGLYYVGVVAVSACGVSAVSNVVPVVVPSPPAPTGLAAAVSGATVALTWTAPGAATGYVIEAGSGPGLANLVPGLAIGATPALLAPTVPAGRYYVRVRARYGVTLSAPSAEIVVDVP